MGRRIECHLLRRAFGDDLSAAVAAFRTQVHDPVRRLDHVQVVLDHHDGIALVAQTVQHGQQLLDVLEMQAGGGLVQNVERLARVALGQLPRQFHPLRLAA